MTYRLFVRPGFNADVALKQGSEVSEVCPSNSLSDVPAIIPRGRTPK